MMRHRIFLFLFIAVAAISWFTPVSSVFAKDPKPHIRVSGMKATYVSQSISDPIVVEAGSEKTVIVKFKNTGTEVWNSMSQHPNGYRHVSAYTVEPRDRSSAFRGGNWISNNQTASIVRDTKPGEIAELRIELQAPQKTGEYMEEFHLASEDYSWVEGGYFFLTIVVKEGSKTGGKKESGKAENKEMTEQALGKGQGSAMSDQTASSTVSYQAKRIFQSTKAATAKGGDVVDMVLAFQNIGPKQWSTYRFIARNASSSVENSESVSFADSSWKNATVVLEKSVSLAQFGMVRDRFRFRAPVKKGVYTASFHVQADEEVLEDAVANVVITVTEDAPAAYQAPHMAQEPALVFIPRLNAEPRIRVGVWKPENFVQFRSYEDDYDIYDGDNLVARLPKKQLAVLKIDNGEYLLTATAVEVRSREYIRLEPVNDPHAVFTLHNFERLVSWKGPVNFNTYRGALEYRRTKDEKVVYVINDLLMEDYVKGIAENSNGSPEEYLKAQSVAQRTYAYYIKEHSDKHDVRNFDVVAHTGDQLYLGYGSEKLMTRFVAAAQATRGYMVTYNADIVITPYFARTNCRTKGWHEVWGGAVRPWLVSVKTTYDCQRGLSALGHLVGMSQIDASLRAEKEGLNFKELLVYYYSGTNAERMYE